MRVALLVLSAVLGMVSACAPGPASELGDAWYEDVTEASGLDFVYFNGMTDQLYLAEITGGGVALLDFDNDGDLDLYFVQGCMIDDRSIDEAAFSPHHELPLTDRLYRNDTVVVRGEPQLRFVDVTEQAGIEVYGYGMGVATGDYDNDGWIDLYVTNFGPNTLLHNNGDGTFSEVTAAAGADDPRWSTSASFFDYDADGLLDIWVVNYLDFSPARKKVCRRASGKPGYCGPKAYQPQPDRLLHNRGDGTFEDVSARAGLLAVRGAGLGVVTADLDGDGLIDAYVANDMNRNHLWVNQGAGSFREVALFAGCAVNDEGAALSGMGVDLADFDGDGDLDIFVGNMRNEVSNLYVNGGAMRFDDKTAESGIGRITWSVTTYGAVAVDPDNDGVLDIVVANGAVQLLQDQEHAGEPLPLRERNQLYVNDGRGRFEDRPLWLKSSAGMEVSRGLAVGDLDNDGDADLVFSNNSSPSRVLLNRVGQRWHWLGLVVRDGLRDQHGAVVKVTLADGTVRVRRVRTDGSYCTANDPRVLVGLGEEGRPVDLAVRWLDGQWQCWPEVEVDRYVTLTKESGQPCD